MDIEATLINLIDTNNTVELDQLLAQLTNDQKTSIDNIIINGHPLLSLAVIMDRIDCVRIIIKYYMDINKKSKTCQTALHVALLHYSYAILDETKQIQLPIIKFLIEYGLDPNAKNNNGVTPLMCICMSQYNVDPNIEDRINIIRLLIDYGADRNAINIRNNTAESMARLWGWTEIADEIRDYKPIPNTKGFFNC